MASKDCMTFVRTKNSTITLQFDVGTSFTGVTFAAEIRSGVLPTDTLLGTFVPDMSLAVSDAKVVLLLPDTETTIGTPDEGWCSIDRIVALEPYVVVAPFKILFVNAPTA